MTDGHAQDFFVGGVYTELSDGQHVVLEQMYVRLWPGSGPKVGRPVVLFHGGGQTGAHYELTPDGRPGLAGLFAAGGRDVYVVDLPGAGRSNRAAGAALSLYGAEICEMMFTDVAAHGGWPQAKLHTRWPGTGRRGDPHFDAFMASQVSTPAGTADAELRVRAAGAALFDRVGPAHLLTHSQSGPYGWHIADARPGLVASVVALEPQGPPFFRDSDDPGVTSPVRPYGITSAPLTYDTGSDEAMVGQAGLGYRVNAEPSTPDRASGVSMWPKRSLPNLAEVPTLLITGEASYHATYDHLTYAFLRAAGVPVEHLSLAEAGITGNGHLLALETNNDQLAEVLLGWWARREADG